MVPYYKIPLKTEYNVSPFSQSNNLLQYKGGNFHFLFVIQNKSLLLIFIGFLGLDTLAYIVTSFSRETGGHFDFRWFCLTMDCFQVSFYYFFDTKFSVGYKLNTFGE